MGSCLSSGNAESSPETKQGDRHGVSGFDAVISVSGPDPPVQAPAGGPLDSSTPNAAAENIVKYSDTVSAVNVEVPSQPDAPVSSVEQQVQDGKSILSEKPESMTTPARPKASFAPADSRMSVYSDTVDLEQSPMPLPALPPDAQLPSAATTPAGNVLMHLNRAMILRNRLGPGAGPPVHLRPSAVASNELTNSGSGATGVGSRILLSSQLPSANAPPANGAEGFGSALVGSGNPYGSENTGDSAVFDNPGVLAPVSGNTPMNCAPGSGVQFSGGGAAVGADSAGMSSASGVSSTLSSAVSAFTLGANAGGGNFASPLYGLGVEATLSEMQQMALIGSGGGGCVYIGRWRGVTVAIKFIVSSDDDQLTRSQREALLSRLASHPHVVQTYATSVTKLTETMFKPKEGAAADTFPGALTAADANISHDLLAGLTTGSWIRGELQMAMNGNESTADGVAGGAQGAGVLPTIMETSRSSMGSASAATSGRGGPTHDGNLQGSVSVNQTTAYESDGQMSSSSTTARWRAPEGASGPGTASGRSGGGSGAAPAVGMASTLPAPQIEPCGSATATANLSCPVSATNSGVGVVPGRLLQTAVDGAGPPLSGRGLHTALGSEPTSGSGPEHSDTGQQPQSSSGGSPRRNCASPGAHMVAAAPAIDTAAAAAAMDAPKAPSGGQGLPVSTAGARAPVGGTHGTHPSGVADSFDASFVRDHMGRAKYSIHEVLRQLGAHEGQFLTMVVMEYCDGGSLLAALKEGPFHRDTTSWSPRMWLRSTVRTALEIAHGMQHLHLSGLVHGDLKPGNVLLKGSNQDKRKFVAKVSDLGIAHPVGAADEMAIDDGRIGSIAYMAPEVFRGRMMKASDVYSFGVLLWQLACGTGAAPFEGAHPVGIALGVSEGKMTLRWPPGVFRPLQQLGELCLQGDPAARPSFKSVVGALEKLERHMQRLAAAAAAGSGPSAHAGSVSLISPASSLSTPTQHALATTSAGQ